jgi:hypothetical protein
VPTLLCRVFFYLLLSFLTAAVPLGAVPAYSVDLPDPLAGKEAPSREGVRTHTLRSLTMLDTPRYPDDFHHFNYVDPDAPKRGTLRTADALRRSARSTIWRLSSCNKVACRYGLCMSNFSRRHAMTRFHPTL